DQRPVDALVEVTLIGDLLLDAAAADAGPRVDPIPVTRAVIRILSRRARRSELEQLRVRPALHRPDPRLAGRGEVRVAGLLCPRDDPIAQQGRGAFEVAVVPLGARSRGLQQAAFAGGALDQRRRATLEPGR